MNEKPHSLTYGAFQMKMCLTLHAAYWNGSNGRFSSFWSILEKLAYFNG